MLSAQSYVPFISTIDSSDTWMDVVSCTDFSCYESRVKRFNIDGDTVIGPHQYSKLMVREEYEQGADQSQWCTESTTIYDYYYGGIRESGKQVFIKPYGMPEYMAYDFNLTIGDTVPSPANLPGNESLRIIDSLDSVMVNGIYRKRYWTSLPTDQYIVEGIGASSGLFNTIIVGPGMCFIKMLCYTEYGAPAHFDYNCSMNLAVDDLSASNSSLELVKIIDSMGREIEDTPNTLMLFIFSDGSSEKVFRMEK